MEPTTEGLARHFAGLEDEALLDAASTRLTLTDAAREALASEIDRRGLELPKALPLPREPEFEFSQWVTLDRFRDLSSGIVARSALESAGIECLLRDENTVRLDWQISNFIGGMRLQVREQDIEEAKAVLAGLALDELPESDSDMPMEGDHCPRCGSLDVHRRNSFGLFSLAAVLAFSIPAPQGRRQWQCSSCGHKWNDDSN